MSTSNDDLGAVSDAFAVHLKSNKHGDAVLNTGDANVRAAWAKLSDQERVAAKLKLRMREIAELQEEYKKAQGNER